jgi:hypothetical protein
VLERDDQHHQREEERVEPFEREFAELGAVPAQQIRDQIVIAWNARGRIQKPDQHHRHGQHV